MIGVVQQIRGQSKTQRNADLELAAGSPVKDKQEQRKKGLSSRTLWCQLRERGTSPACRCVPPLAYCKREGVARRRRSRLLSECEGVPSAPTTVERMRELRTREGLSLDERGRER
ncbi:hypothetical protein PIB30_028512 [Stylosanthes scabra]|uniref:Uncharacterized protein n=1 Tax=Stylosanthes scabra TaxID=79078 RepID=A0ABU6QAX4_9FABA|nr:hypothetical protein [Stylosanthes scabra]